MKNQENVKLKALDSIEGGGAGGQKSLAPWLNYRIRTGIALNKKALNSRL